MPPPLAARESHLLLAELGEREMTRPEDVARQVVSDRLDEVAARMATTLLDATPMASKPTCDAGCHVTLGRERPSGSICDSLAANGGGEYLPTYVRRVLAVS